MTAKYILIIIGIILLMFGFEVAMEKFVEYSYEENPWLVFIFLASSFVFLLGYVAYSLVSQYMQKSNNEKKKEFIRAIIRDLKNLGISLLIAAIIVGLIVFFAIAQDM